jgi:hypothetical protein
LIGWKYTFRWGATGVSYESLDMQSGIYVHYDRFHQIRNWDELAALVERKIEIASAKHNTSAIQELRASHDVIGIVRDYVDYNIYKPTAGYGVLSFSASNGKYPGTNLWLNIYPESERYSYRLQRTDSTKKVTAEDEATLLKLLLEMLEHKPA